ncbi:MAG TPA: tyrosine--tRNA ligase [Geminicoccaceae bacterium]
MSRFRSDLLRAVTSRGFLHQATDLEALDALAARERIVAYIGFDCTADSLHVGNLVGIMLLRLLQRTGHRPIALIGGGTSRVGDPSGKEEARQLLDDATLARNKAGIRRSLEGFLEFGDGPGQAMLVDNADWLDQLAYIPFLREVGRHFTINRMLTFDSVRLRLEREQPLTFLEFNYMIMQAYDFLELARRHDCRLQGGGSDQWGNIVNGVELARRVDGRQLFGLTTPLITTAGGQKMGKTADGAVWLNPDRLPDFDYWQFWRNTEDADVGRFLRLFTDLPLPEIERLERLEGAEINEAKKILANEATKLCRGTEAATASTTAAELIFEAGGGAAQGLPVTEIPRRQIDEGMPVLELLRRSGLADSNGAARRLIRGGGARLNGQRIEDEQLTVGPADLAGGELELSAGKKRHVLIRAI